MSYAVLYDAGSNLQEDQSYMVIEANNDSRQKQDWDVYLRDLSEDKANEIAWSMNEAEHIARQERGY